MKKRDLIEALKPLADDTEIVIVDGVPCRLFEYIDERFRLPLIKNCVYWIARRVCDGAEGGMWYNTGMSTTCRHCGSS